jgi:hypothetical protein
MTDMTTATDRASTKAHKGPNIIAPMARGRTLRFQVQGSHAHSRTSLACLSIPFEEAILGTIRANVAFA